MKISNHIFNVAIAELMKLSNALTDSSPECKQTLSYYQAIRTLLLLLAPMAPHISSELWQSVILAGPKISNSWAGTSENLDVLSQSWPQEDLTKIFVEEKSLAILIQGKKKGVIQIQPTDNKELIEKLVRESPVAQKLIGNQQIKKVIVSEDLKIINFVLDK